MHGHPASVIILKNSHKLCTYGYREDPMGIRAVFSYDNGKTWDTDNIRILRDDGVGNGGDLGYPISVQREDGKIFTIYYMTTQEESFILPKPNRKNNPTLKQQILLEFL